MVWVSAFARKEQQCWQNNILQAAAELALVKDLILLWAQAKLEGLAANCYPEQWAVSGWQDGVELVWVSMENGSVDTLFCVPG